MIFIADTGASNIASVKRWLDYHSIDNCDLSDAISHQDVALIPGVGSWDVVIDNLKINGQWQILKNHKESNGKFIGICLGFQLMMQSSAEGINPGLGIYKLALSKFSNKNLKVPHVGFNDIIFSNKEIKQECYFTHSYYIPRNDSVKINDLISIGYTNYGVEFISFIETKKCLLSQFHPEKSSFGGSFFIEKINRLLSC